MNIPEGPPVFKMIRIENTNLCGYKCIFCPREKLTRPKGIQSLEDFNRILDRVAEYHADKPAFKGAFHLHGYGEPTLDKNLPEKVRIIKEKYPQNQTHIVTTLGNKVSDEYLSALVENGLNSMSVSFYGGSSGVYKNYTRTGDFDVAYGNLMKIVEIRKKIKHKLNLLVKVGFNNFDLGEEKAEVKTLEKTLNDMGVRTAEVAMHNYGDGRDYVKMTGSMQKKLCGNVIFRDVLQIMWDSNVVPCCLDYNGELLYGSLKTSSISEIFSSEPMLKHLRNHCEGKSDLYSACKNCTARTLKPDYKL